MAKFWNPNTNRFVQLENIRIKFRKPLGELMRDVIILTEEQQNKISRFQIMLTAIHLVDSKINLKKIRSLEEAEKIVLERKISDEVFNRAIEMLDKHRGVPKDVPLFGEIAVTLEYVDSKFRNILMKIQSAERVFLIKEGRGEFLYEEIKRKIATGVINKKIIKNDYLKRIDNNFNSLEHIQAVTQAVYIFQAIVSLKPDLKKNGRVNKAINKLGHISEEFFNNALMELKTLDTDHNIEQSEVAEFLENILGDIRKMINEMGEAGSIFPYNHSLGILLKGLKRAMKEI